MGRWGKSFHIFILEETMGITGRDVAWGVGGGLAVFVVGFFLLLNNLVQQTAATVSTGLKVLTEVNRTAKGDKLPVRTHTVREYFGPYHSFDISKRI